MKHRRLDTKLAPIRDTFELLAQGERFGALRPLDQGLAITEEVLKAEANG